ncbi:MAG TPA: erythromycin esterase family protein [Thermoanaerobaculia bacterium]|jgi:erythromycin esterase|nr:erythromycin esterase family protein [Thermoanaerobaculia bacterium]
MSLVALMLLMLARPARPGFADTPAPWLRAHALPLTTAEPTADTSDLEPFLQLLAGKQVIALGDATHGTHELYALKQRLIPLLIQRANVRTAVLEAPYVDVPAPFDNYWFWDTSEVRELLAQIDVEVVGVDPFLAAATIGRVVSVVRAEDAALAEEVARRYECLRVYEDNPLSYGGTAGQPSCRTLILSVRPMLAQRFPEKDELLHAARIVEQGEEAWATNLANRDAAMAENIEWLAARRPDANLVVWGHNEHFGRTPYILNGPQPVTSTGTILARDLGDRYFVLGSVVDHGTFNAAELFGGGGIIRPFPMPAPAADDYATLLRAAHLPLMIVPLPNPLPYWLAGSHRMRIAGSNVSSPDRPMVELTQDLGAKYDAVVYIETSTPTRLTNTSTAARRDSRRPTATPHSE